MLKSEKLSNHVTASARALATVVGDRAKDHCVAMVDAANQVRRFQTDLGATVSERTKAAIETALKGGSSTIDFAHRLVEHETAAAKSFIAVKSPSEFMQVRDAYLASTFNLLSTEAIASTERFFDTLSGWAIWPSLAPKTQPAA